MLEGRCRGIGKITCEGGAGVKRKARQETGVKSNVILSLFRVKLEPGTEKTESPIHPNVLQGLEVGKAGAAQREAGNGKRRGSSRGLRCMFTRKQVSLLLFRLRVCVEDRSLNPARGRKESREVWVAGALQPRRPSRRLWGWGVLPLPPQVTPPLPRPRDRDQGGYAQTGPGLLACPPRGFSHQNPLEEVALFGRQQRGRHGGPACGRRRPLRSACSSTESSSGGGRATSWPRACRLTPA